MIKHLTLFLIFLLTQSILQSQVVQEWVQRFENPPNGVYGIAAVKADNQGNVFVSGSMSSASVTDYVTIKYNSAGVQQWARIYSGLIEDRVIDMALDNSGNVLVTGFSENQTGTFDIITIKYSTLGDSLWVKRYNGANDFTMDQPVAMDIDGNNNIYVSGYSFGSSPMNYVTIKYSPDGDSLWVARYSSGGTDIPSDIYVDEAGNVYVYGEGVLILKYNPDGNLLWSKTYPIEAAESNKVLCGDGNGNIFFAGTKSTATFGDFAVVKINSEGDTLWTRTYNGLGNSETNHDDPAAITIDSNGNVILTGKSYNMSSYFFSTIKYSANGVFLWERIYSNPQNSEGGTDILTDNAGNIYVTGGSNAFTTIKYNSNGDSLWAMIYNGPSNMFDIPSAMTKDNSDNIYVTGRSRHSGSEAYYDIATLKYSQTTTGISQENNLIDNYRLYQNYPNPFNPSTKIRYSIPSVILPQAQGNIKVTLKVYDILGNQVAALVDEYKQAGIYEVEFSSKGELSSGIYYYHLQAGEFSQTKKLILLK
jgi:uncharacterized delta-60 repeat protein